MMPFSMLMISDKSSLKLNNILYIETYGDKSKVVNPKIPYKVYQCNSPYVEPKEVNDEVGEEVHA